MSKLSVKLLLVAIGALALTSSPALSADGPGQTRGIRLEQGKVEESEARAKLEAPNFGYVGDLGSFVVSGEGHSGGLIVVHHYPDTGRMSLEHTRLTYEGPKRLGNLDGWMFKTQWDGKTYPSKIFFSAEPVYFGGGVSAYIAADYREGTGWAWKQLPLRRMDVIEPQETSAHR